MKHKPAKGAYVFRGSLDVLALRKVYVFPTTLYIVKFVAYILVRFVLQLYIVKKAQPTTM